MDNYYETLGVSEQATAEEIKKKYRKLSMKFHPDRGGHKETFQKINTAYQILGEPTKRKQYDMTRSGNPLSHLFGRNGESDMGGLFNMFFGGEMSGGMGQPTVKIFHNGRAVNMGMQARKPPPIIKTIEISLQQSYTGMNYPLELERWIKDDEIRKTEKERIYVDIPKGVDNNEILIINGKGNVSINDVRGDIKLHIIVKNNTEFIRDGLDLIISKDISLKEALLGFKFEICHLSGKSYVLNNDNGTIIKPNYKKNIEGLGMIREKKSNNGIREIKGSLIMCFNIEFPKELSEEQRKKLNELL
jgi:DnaJ-class molecular chaperone